MNINTNPVKMDKKLCLAKYPESEEELIEKKYLFLENISKKYPVELGEKIS